MDKKKKILLIIVGIFIVLLSIVATVAYFTAQISGNPSNNNVSSNMDTLRLTFSDNTGLVEGNGIAPGWTHQKIVTVENTGTASVTYDLVWLNVENEITNDEMVYSITCTSNCNGLEETAIPSLGKKLKIVTNTIDKDETQVYTITFTFKELNSPQDYNQNKNFSGNIGILESGTYSENNLSDWTYTLDDINNKITLTKYVGTNNNVEIYPQYIVNGSIYNTVINSGTSMTNYLFKGSNSTIQNVKFLGNVEFLNNSMAYLFYNCKSLKNIHLSKLNTTNVTDMSSMFNGCNSLTSLDVTHFNTANVTKMGSMFYGCRGLTSLDLSNFNTSNVTNMYGMFSGCTGLTSLDVTNFNTINVTIMSKMFEFCSALTSLDVTHFNTANVTKMESMFRYCSGLTSLDVTHFNTANVNSMYQMFQGCSSLTSLDVTHFNTSNVNNMYQMFAGCSSLTSLDVTHFNTQNVTSMQGLFASCSALTTLDLSNFNTSKVKSTLSMFYNCSNLSTIYVSIFDISNVTTNSNQMFEGCTSIVGGNGTTYNSSKTNKTYARIDVPGTPGYFTAKA